MYNKENGIFTVDSILTITYVGETTEMVILRETIGKNIRLRDESARILLYSGLSKLDINFFMAAKNLTNIKDLAVEILNSLNKNELLQIFKEYDYLLKPNNAFVIPKPYAGDDEL